MAQEQKNCNNCRYYHDGKCTTTMSLYYNQTTRPKFKCGTWASENSENTNGESRQVEQNVMFVLKHKKGYFKEQNLYLGQAILTDDLECASLMDLDKAERRLSCMTKPDEWEIWSVKYGLVLSEKNTRHIQRAKKIELEKQIADLGDIET